MSQEQELTEEEQAGGWVSTLRHNSGETTPASLDHSFKLNICVNGTLLSLRYPQLFDALP